MIRRIDKEHTTKQVIIRMLHLENHLLGLNRDNRLSRQVSWFVRLLVAQQADIKYDSRLDSNSWKNISGF
jgi:hypothetical protein